MLMAHIFHVPNRLRGYSANAPHLFPMRLQFVFLGTCVRLHEKWCRLTQAPLLYRSAGAVSSVPGLRAALNRQEPLSVPPLGRPG
jgi:hypothetical protein